jgi:sodium-dependent dicarboxylate transporter 2/3/5
LKRRTWSFVVVPLVLLALAEVQLGLLSAWGIPEPGHVALFILVLAALLWITELLPLFVTSLVILLLCLTWLRGSLLENGIEVGASTFTAPFFSDIILLFLGGFVLAAGLQKYRLDEQMARWVMRKTGRSVPRLIAGIMAITAFLSMWLSNTATAAMMLSLCLPIIRRLEEDDRYRKAILLAVPFSANIGGLGTPIGSPPNAIAMQYLAELNAAPGFAQWMLAGVPMAAILLVVAWLLLTRIYRGHPGKPDFESEPIEIERTPGLIVVGSVTLVTVLGWLTTGLHPFSSGTVGLIPVIVLFGTRILDTQDLRRLSWDVLLMMGGGLCLGAAISISGLADWLVGILPTEGAEVWMLIIAFGFMASLMSSVMSNTATANLIMPVVIGLTFEPVSPILIGVAYACSLAMPLPISTPPNAIAFSSGALRAGDMIRPGVLITAAGLVLTFFVCYWWWGFVGLF